jgi:antitoxin component HigA of HigAB toxin-antitoxin module
MKEIKSEKEYQEVLEIIEELFDSLPNTIEGEELLRLVKLIEDYENKHYPI